MNAARTLFLPVLISSTLTFGQKALVGEGKPFTRSFKNATGDQHQVITGLHSSEGNALLYVVENGIHKVVRVDQRLEPSDELALHSIPYDGLLWQGAAPVIVDGSMHCLLVAPGKRSADYAIGVVETRGAPALSGIRRIASSELPYLADPTYTLPRRPLPDPILSSKGLLFVEQERIIAAPDGEHFLLSNHTKDEKGGKRFWFAYLDKEFTMLWSGVKELPYADTKSRIHQISLGNEGSIHLVGHVFACASEEQMRDKLCHELHLTTLTDRGNTVTDVLIEKDFVSTARLCERDSGRVSMAIRYGALTGQQGIVITFDPHDPKLKGTPVVDQRAYSIHKTKLVAYGSIDPGEQRKTPSRTAKVPDEIVEIMTARDGGLLLVETFLDEGFQVPMDGAIAMRRLCGDIRVSLVAANDTVQWEQVLPRAFMTTAGRDYEGIHIQRTSDGLTLFFDHTPRGLEAILRSGTAAPDGMASEGKNKKDKLQAPMEAGVLKAIALDGSGEVLRNGTVLIGKEDLVPCPSCVILDPYNGKYLVKSYDRNTTYKYSTVDPSLSGE
ncbi:MAG: hypothetical protein KDC00_09800 [Flavobacteriales bacterium]|nr:hypothetical protein [Flavobacteriales bacterium]